MITGLLVSSSNVNKKDFFSSKKARDNLADHWIEMRNFFLNNGIKLVTEDQLEQSHHSFEIHIDVKDKINSKVPAFLLAWESKFVIPKNIDQTKLNQYHRIFSWDTKTSNFKNATKFFFPHLRAMRGLPDGYLNRKKLVVMIAGNKSLPNFNNLHNLYLERVKTIRWFEKHFPNDFDLYGADWDKSARIPSKLGGLIHKIEEKVFSPRFKFKSWRGAPSNKDNILKYSKFSIAYENLSDQYDYITEKIFDCFCFGNIPIYWGAKNILDYIPKNCFIDRRSFKSHFELYSFINEMREDTFIKYQNNIKNFLNSDRASIFLINSFIQTVPGQIVKDLKKLKCI